MAKGKILIVEDDPDIVEMVEYNLRDEGYEVLSALNGQDGIGLAKTKQPDLIILDIMLPLIDGFDVCRILKSDQVTVNTPIIILSARSQETDKVVGLELGADDYVTKPFSPRELIARIRAILRREQGPYLSTLFERGDILVDSSKHKVKVKGREVSLTHKEFKILELMARKPGVVLSRDQILDAVSGDDAVVCDRTVDAHIKSLRKKLGSANDYIQTIRSAGYRFEEV